MSKVLDFLYLGDLFVAVNKGVLDKIGITHILTVASGLKPSFPKDFNYKCINILDMPSSNIQQHFAKCRNFINK